MAAEQVSVLLIKWRYWKPLCTDLRRCRTSIPCSTVQEPRRAVGVCKTPAVRCTPGDTAKRRHMSRSETHVDKRS